MHISCISDDFSIKHANPTVHPPVSLALCLQNTVRNDDTSLQENREISFAGCEISNESFPLTQAVELSPQSSDLI